MKSLQLSTHIAQDGFLHIPIPECTDQDIGVTVLYSPRQAEPADALIGEKALKLAQSIGFIGCLEAEANFSTRYKDELDWSHKV